MSDSSPFSSNSFYGGTSKRKQKNVKSNLEKRLKEFEAHPIPEDFKTRITGPPTSWETFFRQQEAFQYARSKSKDLHVFAYESDLFGQGQGQRMYVAVSYPTFWHYYSQLQSEQKHHYEVIPEGTVCKLYFDLEFSKEANPDSNGASMVKLLKQYVSCWLKHIYKLDCGNQDILDLDASTPSKFSRHLVFQLPSAAFKDNTHIGNFVQYIFGKLRKFVQSKETEPSASENESNSSDVNTILNRNINKSEITKGDNCHSGYSTDSFEDEIVRKSKPDIANTPADVEQTLSLPQSNIDASMPVKETRNVDEEIRLPDLNTRVFSDTLVSDVQRSSPDHSKASSGGGINESLVESFGFSNLKTLIVMDKNGEDVLFCDTAVYTKNRNFRLHLSSKLGKRNPLVISPDNAYQPVNNDKTLFLDSLISNVSYTSKLKILTFENRNHIRIGQGFQHKPVNSKQNTVTDPVEGYSLSPYPEIDEFIAGLLDRDGVKGTIRHWTYFSQGELLVYDIANYRWCANVQRHHKSNNIMMIADLLQAVYYQKCLDPICRQQNYKSPEEALPAHVLPAYYFRDEDEMGGLDGEDGGLEEEEGGLEDDGDDEELMKSAIEAEDRLLLCLHAE